jgi:hypothetical protein
VKIIQPAAVPRSLHVPVRAPVSKSLMAPFIAVATSLISSVAMSFAARRRMFGSTYQSLPLRGRAKSGDAMVVVVLVVVVVVVVLVLVVAVVVVVQYRYPALIEMAGGICSACLMSYKLAVHQFTRSTDARCVQIQIQIQNILVTQVKPATSCERSGCI